MMKHSVVFTFKEEVDEASRRSFLEASGRLSQIPGVRNLEVLRQVSTKNNFEYGILMEFETNEVYQSYKDHPLHAHFIKEYWLKYVGQFMEIDFESL